MARKRKAPPSQLANEHKPKAIREEVVEKEEEEASDEEENVEEEEVEVEEEVEIESSSEEEQSESQGEDEDLEEEEEEEEDAEEEEEEEEPNDDASKREIIRQLLEPFAKSQIIDLIKQAAADDPNILPKIVEVAYSDPTHRKIFVHGIGWDATSEQLVQTFEPFGEIEESKLVTDRNTGLPKGYAFVLFKTWAAAKKALKVTQKQIGSRMVSCQLAALGPPPGMGAGAEGGSRKLYVGNVGSHVCPEKLKAFFGKYGEIEEGPLGMDVVNKFKGFAIITYRSPEGYQKSMEEPIKVFDNCQLHCKKFLENQNKNYPAVQSGAAIVNPSVANVNYGNFGTNLNASAFLMAQNAGMGLAGNAMLAATGYNPVGLAVSGLSTPGVGGTYGEMGNYGSQAALHGLGAFQNAQIGQSSLGTAGITANATRSPASGALVPKTYTSYFGI
ncbi:hypothetical protein OROGR_016920 [Orobanche gracilis]